MVGKKSGKALKEEGLARTDNQMGLTSWPQIVPINQKNYYTDYLKRDDQILAYRIQQEEARNRMTKQAKDRDRALALGNAPPTDADGDQEMEDEDGEDDKEEGGQDPSSKVVVIHLGSRNLRIGLSSDALPKTVPSVIAKKATMNESEEGDGEPLPKRVKLEDGSWPEPEKQFGAAFAKTYTTMCSDLKTRMRLNKRRVLPNSKEMVINYNRRTPPDEIPEHNDPLRIEWTEIPSDAKAAPEWISGKDALRIPDNSRPRYKLFWPLRNGWINETDYKSQRVLFQDIALIIVDAIRSQLGLDLRTRRDWAQYGCVFIIPDLYERAYVTNLLDMGLRELGFGRVCFIQESLAASFGAGYTTTCIVDIGAQKTSICCVEEGMCSENSRVNLKFGGEDITETFIKMMLFDYFPYEDINLKRRYDFLLANELKQKFCTMNEGEVSVQLLDFHLRASGQDTRKYTFKAYDEVLLAPMGLFVPQIFDHERKLRGRHTIMDRSRDLYDGQPNDPTSQAQADILRTIAPHLAEQTSQTNGHTNGEVNNTPSKPPPIPALSRVQESEATPRSSVTGSPAPEGEDAPATKTRTTPPPIANAGFDAEPDPPPEPLAIEYRDDVLPIFPLDSAILTSISYAAKGDERKTKDFFGGIMVIGGGSQIPGFSAYLEEKLHALRPMYAKDIMIGIPPRELDAQVVVWKGASVFGKLSNTNDSWIGQMEYDRLGSRLLAYKWALRNGIGGEIANYRQNMGWSFNLNVWSKVSRAERLVASESRNNSLFAFPLLRLVGAVVSCLFSLYQLFLQRERTFFRPDLRPLANVGNMADTKGMYKQDMVVSTRYRNDLPPPPMPPKLLNMDTGGIEQYLTPGFASNMARREDPNIEADAEGGMPIDMIGIPGYFLGDESAIMAPDHQPLLDPADIALMATPEQLRNASGKASNVSFLRRTQYIAAGAVARNDNMLRTTTMRPKPLKSINPNRETPVSRDDPIYIKRYIQKGFDIAYPETKQASIPTDPQLKALPATASEIEAWKNPVHPDNHKLRPVEFYPLLPDLEGFPELGGYASVKFDKAPLPATESGKRDDRIDVGLLQATTDPDALPAWEARSKAYESNPEFYEHPGEAPMNLALHLPTDSSVAPRIKVALDDSHPSKDANPTVEGNPEPFEYSRQRIYNIAAGSHMGDNPYRSVALTLFDPSSPSLSQHARLKSSGQGKAAYYYPVNHIMKLRAKAPIAAAATMSQQRRQAASDENAPTGVSDSVTLMVHPPDDEKLKLLTSHRANVDSLYKKQWDDKYPKEPTPTPPPEPVPPLEQIQKNGMHDDDEDEDEAADVRMTGSEEQALRNAAAGVVSENGDEDDDEGGDEDMDAEGEADDSE